MTKTGRRLWRATVEVEVYFIGDADYGRAHDEARRYLQEELRENSKDADDLHLVRGHEDISKSAKGSTPWGEREFEDYETVEEAFEALNAPHETS